jgi:hypothetical protein
MRRVGNSDEGRSEDSRENGGCPFRRGWVRGAVGRPDENTKGVCLNQGNILGIVAGRVWASTRRRGLATEKPGEVICMLIPA